jgi:hypothetical protein
MPGMTIQIRGKARELMACLRKSVRTTFALPETETSMHCPRTSWAYMPSGKSLGTGWGGWGVAASHLVVNCLDVHGIH